MRHISLMLRSCTGDPGQGEIESGGKRARARWIWRLESNSVQRQENGDGREFIQNKSASIIWNI